MSQDATPDVAVDPRVTRTRNDVLAATIRILIDEGWEAVTQPHVARVAGYAKATVYAHWPDRIALVRDAFARYGDMPHHERTGDLRADLVGELTTFREAFVEHRLDRALAVLAERSSAVPELAAIRDAFVQDGERPIRDMLAGVTGGAAHEASAVMLCGLVTHAVLLDGRPPQDDVIAAAVDLLLRGLGHPEA